MTLSPQVIGILIGGILPALVYALGGLFQKGSIDAGIGVGMQLFIVGVAVMLVGGVFSLLSPDRTLTLRSGFFAFGLGCSWALATGLVAVALATYRTPLSVLTPLYNMNTLIVVLLALWIFAEWREVKVLQLIIGSMLIVIGGTLVARA